MSENKNSMKRKARIAGLWYLLLAAVGPIYLVYIPSVFIVPNNASATVHNIVSSPSLFHFGIATELIGAVASVFLVLALYDLFRDVDRKLAMAMVILGGVISVAISFVSVLAEVVALYVMTSPSFLSVFTTPQLNALAMVFLNLHSQGQSVINGVFYGLWLLPFGLLVYRSRFFPRVLGIWLVLNGFAYLASSLATMFLPSISDPVSEVAAVFYTGELAMLVWLLVKGARLPLAAQKADSDMINNGMATRVVEGDPL